MKTNRHILVLLGLFLGSNIFAQETLNTNDPNTYIFGGDQKSNIATIDLLPIHLVDVESDPDNTISFGIDATNLEAGQPAMGSEFGGSSTNETLWLNFTHRGQNYRNAVINVRSNLPIPEGIRITIQIINTGLGGDYPKNPRFDPVLLNPWPQPIVYSFANGYTADGTGNGYQLRYSLENTSGASLPEGFEIIYEITPQ